MDGTLDVQLIDGIYFINGLLTDTNNRQFKVDYRGALSFEIGEDDPESSGYTAILTKSQVYQMDANWQPILYPDVTKYTFTITDPDGNDAGSFDAINVNNAGFETLKGEYTVQGSSTQAGLMDAGWTMPQYGMAGGSYFTDNKGERSYIVAGKVNMDFVTGIDGSTLVTISGSGVSTMNANGEAATTPGSFSIKFATVIEATGTELRDQTFSSTVLGRDMKYSICLPASFDGTKEYPVLYMLHGYGGGNNDWLNGGMMNAYSSAAAANGDAPEMIIVCPDGMGTFYCNGFQDGMQYMTYFFDEFLPFIESTYKVKSAKESRAIGGLSMGGFGSLYYGFLHPEMFSYVYACSPAAYIEGAPNLFEMMSTADKSTLPGFTIESGTEDPVVGEGPAGLVGAMMQFGIQCDYIARPGVHDWAFWRACSPKIINKVGSVIK